MKPIIKTIFFSTLTLLFLFTSCVNKQEEKSSEPNVQDKQEFVNGLPDDPAYFPIAVWLQDAEYAKDYKEIGINLYVAKWGKMTEEYLDLLKEAEMPIICGLDEITKKHIENPIIVGWHMLPDEPDNAQPAKGEKHKYGPCEDPEDTKKKYDTIKAIDSTRPVYLGLGVGISYHGYRGRGGECSGDTTMYPEYTKAGDIFGWDVYPLAGPPQSRVFRDYSYIGYGMDNMMRWAHGKPTWMAIATTRIRKFGLMPNGDNVQSAVWMAIIHGAKGIVYFSHGFYPKLDETGLLNNKPVAEAVKKMNAQITELAPVINSPNVEGLVKVAERPFEQTVDLMVKKYNGDYYIFTIEANGEQFSTSLILDKKIQGKKVEVLYEGRTIDVQDGTFSDTFTKKEGFTHHIYRISGTDDSQKYSNIYNEDFFEGLTNWELNDKNNWEVIEENGVKVLHLKKAGEFGKVRKPSSFAALKNIDASDFELTLEAKCLVDSAVQGRDLAVYFDYQDSLHFYYTHISNDIHKYHNMIGVVNGKDREPIANTFDKPETARLTDYNWHKIKVTQNSSKGEIEVFVDNMITPVHSIIDTTLTHGSIGVGSFDDFGMFKNIQLKYNLDKK
ncbi:MAG: hypothetical protein ABFS16_14400 [Bacteroidota bacterium]